MWSSFAAAGAAVRRRTPSAARSRGEGEGSAAGGSGAAEVHAGAPGAAKSVGSAALPARDGEWVAVLGARARDGWLTAKAGRSAGRGAEGEVARRLVGDEVERPADLRTLWAAVAVKALGAGAPRPRPAAALRVTAPRLGWVPERNRSAGSEPAVGWAPKEVEEEQTRAALTSGAGSIPRSWGPPALLVGAARPAAPLAPSAREGRQTQVGKSGAGMANSGCPPFCLNP